MKSIRNKTYTQIHIQMVFAVQNRGSLILDTWRERLYKYLIAIIQNNRHKVLAIGGTADHVHILIGMRPSQSLSDFMHRIFFASLMRLYCPVHGHSGQFNYPQIIICIL